MQKLLIETIILTEDESINQYQKSVIMKSANIITVLIYMLIHSTQAQEIIMDYYPEKPTTTADVDYARGKQMLSNIYQSIKDHNNEMVYADYWNVGIAYSYMRLEDTLILSFLKKAKTINEDSFCHIIAYALDRKSVEENRLFKLLGSPFKNLVSDCDIGILKRTDISERYKIKDGMNLTGLNEHLIDKLIILMDKDQYYRFSPTEYNSNWETQTKLDKEIEIELAEIFDTYGYPGKSLVGEEFMNHACLLLEHGGTLAHQEKYFPLVTRALANEEVDKSFVRMLIDRIHWKKTRKQIFGSHAGVPFDESAIIEKIKKTYGL